MWYLRPPGYRRRSIFFLLLEETLVGSLQLDIGAEEERTTSAVGEVAADLLKILRLSILGVRGVANVDPVESADS